MKIVVQEDDLGCAVACVAMIVGCSYADALSFFDKGKVKAQTVGFICKEIITALHKAGLEYEYKYLKPKLAEKVNLFKTIIYMNRSKLFPYGHYVVRTSNGWIDPWIYNSPDGKVAGIRNELPEKPIYIILLKGKNLCSSL